MSSQWKRQYPGLGIIKDPTLGILFDAGTSVPSAVSGYAIGSFFMKLSATGPTSWYRNDGTFASCTFNLIQNGVDLTGLTATAAELNRAAKNSTRPVAAGAATLTVTQANHDGKTILLDQATGTAVTLPAMTGSGARYRFAVTATKSGGSDVITATGAHLFGGMTQNTDSANGSSGFTTGQLANASGSTVITLNGTTTGGRKGDWFEIEDVAASYGQVRGALNASGTEATPFS